jgi:thiol-disulfide isomerase/thioredoxin
MTLLRYASRLVPIGLGCGAFLLALTGCFESKVDIAVSADPSAASVQPAAVGKLSCPLCCSELSRSSLLLQAAKPATADTVDAVVELKTIKLAQLLQEIKGSTGKLVVVDLWADFCIPCKKGFPHLVEMHRRYAKEGLVCISVSVDDPKNREVALKFLKQKAATFRNYLLEDAAEVWQEHWNITAIPAVFLYRDGKQIAKFDYDDPDNQFTYDDVEKAVVKHLRK